MSDASSVELLDGGGTRAAAVRAARTFAALAALSCGVAAAALLSVNDAHLRRVGWGWLTNAGICAVALAVLLMRRRCTARQAEAASLVLIGSTLVAQVHADWTSALSSMRFAPFEGFKAVALAVATLALFGPALSYGVVAVCAIAPVVIFAMMPAALRVNLPVEAPWTTLVYPLLATGIVMYRIRALRMEREVTRARARREQLERFAKVSLAYRDLVNSPLQTIELVCAVLRKEHPESRALVDRLLRCASRLSAMGEMLSRTEHHVVWTSKEEAFDAAKVIEEYHRAAES